MNSSAWVSGGSRWGLLLMPTLRTWRAAQTLNWRRKAGSKMILKKIVSKSRKGMFAGGSCWSSRKDSMKGWGGEKSRWSSSSQWTKRLSEELAKISLTGHDDAAGETGAWRRQWWDTSVNSGRSDHSSGTSWRRCWKRSWRAIRAGRQAGDPASQRRDP